ncbi:hypothetical protein [Bacteroides sp. 519]|uniref:hypothetical protein n=1 Tax=Bacteroides sp. 519 TaxID=2302937 RepID=UPI0013D02523|nr:hypothetical protein [Bacteroides sp. 519]NDV57705.1 hypothetical protein [Bacteroides sp. 519]
MKKLIYCFTLLFCLLPLVKATAQSQKIRVYIETSYLYGLAEKGDGFKLTRSDSKMSGVGLHLSALYSFSKTFSVGLGLGLDRYNNPGYNSLPLFVSLQCMPLNFNRNIYVFTNVGYGVGGADFTKGAMLDAGVGYKLILKESFGINLRLGYNLKQIDTKVKDFWGTTEIGRIDRNRHSLFIAIGAIL